MKKEHTQSLIRPSQEAVMTLDCGKGERGKNEGKRRIKCRREIESQRLTIDRVARRRRVLVMHRLTVTIATPAITLLQLSITSAHSMHVSAASNTQLSPLSTPSGIACLRRKVVTTRRQRGG